MMHDSVAVLGFGVEGVSVVSYLLSIGKKVTVFYETNNEQTTEEKLAYWKSQQVQFVFGKIANLGYFPLIIRSPGIRPDLPAIQYAVKDGAVLSSMTELFFDVCPCPIIGVTGTKGKGTTSSLIYEMLKADGRDVYLGGNIGVASLSFLPKLTKESIVVLEMSSFQLFTLKKSPQTAVIVMTSVDHLDYHVDPAEYLEAKRSIVRNQKADDAVVYFADYANSRAIVEGAQACRFAISQKHAVTRGAFVKEGILYFVDGKTPEKIIDCSEIFIPGRHNWENAAAAVAVAKIHGVSQTNIVRTLKTFTGLVHRLEYVATVDGVKYFDDSFSTTPETAIAALAAFTEPKVMILGGSSKGSNFDQLGKELASCTSLRGIIGIGDEWGKIRSAIEKYGKVLCVEGCKNMTEIVEGARTLAKRGDVVILSPACASFDMFNNYKERGNLFKEEVKKGIE